MQTFVDKYLDNQLGNQCLQKSTEKTAVSYTFYF